MQVSLLLLASLTGALKLNMQSDPSKLKAVSDMDMESDMEMESEFIHQLQEKWLVDPSKLKKRTRKIPRVLHQTTQMNVSCIPDTLGSHADGLERRVYNDDMAIKFLEEHYKPAVVARFKSNDGPHRADLFRYALLYIEGGLYADIKVMPAMDLIDFFKENRTKYTWYTVTSAFHRNVFNGFIATPPRNPHFLQMLEYTTEHIARDYDTYIRQDARLIGQDYLIGAFAKEVHQEKKYPKWGPGVYENAKTKLILLNEVCGQRGSTECKKVPSGHPDRYHLCCNIYDSPSSNNKKFIVLHTREHSYPMGKRWKACKDTTLQAMPEKEAKKAAKLYNEVMEYEETESAGKLGNAYVTMWLKKEHMPKGVVVKLQQTDQQNAGTLSTTWTNNGINRAKSMAKKLQQLESKYPLVILTNDPSLIEINQNEALKAEYPNVVIQEMNEENWLEQPCATMQKNLLSFQKLSIFGMTEYNRLLWLDMDVNMHKNMDSIFDEYDVKDGQQIYGQQDNFHCFNDRKTDNFSSGLMLIKPQKMHLEGMLEKARSKSFCWGDQKIIAEYFEKDGRSRVNFPRNVINYAHCGAKEAMASHDQQNKEKDQ